MLIFLRLTLSRSATGGHEKSRIVTQLLMVVGVFVARGDRENATGENLALMVRGVTWIPRIGDSFSDAANQI